MRPPRRGVSYSAALAQAYATAPEDEIVLDTLELLHPTFVDDEGNPIPVRVVNDHDDLVCTLEDTAPLNPGEEVTFKAGRFVFQRPPETESAALPEVQVKVDNVSKYLTPFLDKAKESLDPITLIWRPYCTSDLGGPHMNPPMMLSLRGVSVTMTSVQGRAGFADIGNRRFPAIEYVGRNFPGLVVR